jgi:hypothetical protein
LKLSTYSKNIKIKGNQLEYSVGGSSLPYWAKTACCHCLLSAIFSTFALQILTPKK